MLDPRKTKAPRYASARRSAAGRLPAASSHEAVQAIEPTRDDGTPRPGAALESLNRGLLLLDRDARVSVVTEGFDALIGFRPGFARAGVTARDLVAEAHARGLHGPITLADAFEGWLGRLRSLRPSSHQVTTADGRTLLVSYVPVQDGGWMITYEDATTRLETAQVLATQNERFNAALANMPHGLCMFDGESRLILCNAAYARLYALPADLTQPGTKLDAILAHRASVGNAPADLSTYLDVIAEASEKGSFAGRRAELQDGRTIQITHNPMASGGYVATHEDITAAIRAEAEIRYLGTHDALTGLANRASVRQRLTQALARTRRGETLAVHCLDLDEFKLVNDTLGHPVGDLLLKAVTERFLDSIRESDVVARLGGDEFIVLQGGVDRPEDASSLARRLVERISAPFRIDGHPVSIGVSIGIALCPNDGTEVDEVLKNADIALYRAKTDGRNTYRFFELSMDAPVQARRRLELDLRAALANGDFELHYQPLIDAESGAIKGFEALLRWDHPERGAISPIEFIPLAEEGGLIVPLGDWVLRQACRDAASWPEHVGVAVNLSPFQFRDSGLVEVVLSALSNARLAPSRLELEITESVLLIDSEGTRATLHHLRNLGVRIALDDFGTGYSSLSYLRSFPFDKIKIDKSFIRDLGDVGDCSAIVKAVTGLASALGMVTTAEGVETEDQLRRVREQGCKEVQGYIFSVPRPANELAALLADPPFRTNGRDNGRTEI